MMQAIIYVNTRRKVDFLLDKMTSRDFTVSALVQSIFQCRAPFACTWLCVSAVPGHVPLRRSALAAWGLERRRGD